MPEIIIEYSHHNAWENPFRSKMDHSTDYFLRFWRKLHRATKACFITALLAGLLTHIYMITNKMTNWDDIMVIPDVGIGPFVGRWMQLWLHTRFSKWGAPGLNGVMAVLLLAAAACFIVETLQIRSVTGAVLLAILFVTFPSVTSTMTFMQMVPMYMLAMLLMCAGCWAAVRLRFGWIVCVICIMYSLAIYQAYLPLLVSLFILTVLGMIIDGENIRRILLRALGFILTTAAGLVLYYISLKIRGYEMASYKGMDQIGQASPSELIHALMRTYHRVIQYFGMAPESFMKGSPNTFSKCVWILTAALWIYVLIVRRIWKSVCRTILYIIASFLIPLSMGLIYVMSVQTQHASTVMTFAYVTFYILTLLLAEKAATGAERGAVVKAQGGSSSSDAVQDKASIKDHGGASSASRRRPVLTALSICTVFVMLCVGYNNFKIANTAYYRIYIANTRVYGFLNRIMASLEQQGDYEYGQDIFIAGNITEDNNPIDVLSMDEEDFSDMEGLAAESGLLLPTNRNQYIRLFLGIDVNKDVDQSVRDKIMSSEEYKSMPIYPADGSIRRFDDLWVIRITNQ